MNIKCCQHHFLLLPERICMAMIASFKFDDLISSGISPCQSNGTHAGFCSAAHHPYQINIWYHGFDQFSHFYFQFCWCTKRSRIDAFSCIAFTTVHRHDPSIIGPQLSDVINILIAICIIQISTFCAFNKYRVPPTLLNARTGEFTPPGIDCCARSNRCSLL